MKRWPAFCLSPLLLVGCASKSDFAMGAEIGAMDEAASSAAFDAAIELRVDVYPAELRDSLDDEGFRVLPQSHVPFGLIGAEALDVGTVALVTPQQQTGTVVGYQTNPLIASLPGTQGPVESTVYIKRDGTIQSYAARSDSAGVFATWLVPQDVYEIVVVPDDPQLPLWSDLLTIGSSTSDLTLDIGIGTPIYGQVTSTSGPVAGARVYAQRDDGTRTATTVATEAGLYQVRVTEGTWTVICEGREVGQDPTLTEVDVVVDADGTKLDFMYPTDLPQVLAEGRVTSPSGGEVTGSLVRFVSEELNGFGAVDGSWTWEAPTAGNGTFIAKVVPGLYTVEILPPTVESGQDFTPDRLVGVRIGDEGADLGDLELLRLATVEGSVVSSAGAALAGAVLDCTEIGFDGRSWFATTDEDGLFTIELPRIPVECLVAPPGDRGDLATSRIVVDASDNATPTLELSTGSEVSGRVTLDGAGEEYAVVEIRDLDAKLLGYGLSDDEGRFSVRVDLGSGRVITDGTE